MSEIHLNLDLGVFKGFQYKTVITCVFSLNFLENKDKNVCIWPIYHILISKSNIPGDWIGYSQYIFYYH